MKKEKNIVLVGRAIAALSAALPFVASADEGSGAQEIVIIEDEGLDVALDVVLVGILLAEDGKEGVLPRHQLFETGGDGGDILAFFVKIRACHSIMQLLLFLFQCFNQLRYRLKLLFFLE